MLDSSIRSRLNLFAALGVLLSLSGCGTETYNQRLAETQKLFDQINEFEENLGRPWAESGIEINMPKQFAVLPPPAMLVDTEGQPIKDDEGKVMFDEDQRQPHYMTEPLPGLLAAWSGTVEADVSGEPKDVKAYAYLLASHEYWMNNDPEGATAFHTTVLQAVVDGFSIVEPVDSDWQIINYPSSPGMIPQKSAQVLVNKTTRFVDETRAEFSLHLFESGDNRIALLFVYPDTINPQERLTERINLALQTLQISTERPAYAAPAAGGGGGGGAPAGGGGIAF